MTLILTIVVMACFALNLQASADLSSASGGVLCVELVAVLVAVRAIVYNMVRAAGRPYCEKLYCAFLAFLALTLLLRRTQRVWPKACPKQYQVIRTLATI